MTLPNMDDIPNYTGGIDGCSYDVEIATKNNYRFYDYWEPETVNEKHWQAKNLVHILNLIEAEFEFKRLSCD